MSESDSRSPTSPPIANHRSAESPAVTSSSLGASFVLLGKRYAHWVERWAPVLRQWDEALAEMAQRLAPYVRAIDEIARSPGMERVVQGLAAFGQLMDAAPGYCAPYDRELVRFGLAPLTEEEQVRFTIIAALIRGRAQVQLGCRPPLEQVALLAERPEVTVAMVMERAATRSAIRSLEILNEREEGELLTDAYLELQETIVPSIQRHLSRVPMADFRRVLRPALTQVVRDAYMVKSLRRALVRQLGLEAQRKEKEEQWDDEVDRHHSARHQEDQHLNWEIEQAMASFLERPRASELDRKLVAALRRWPDASAAEIARRISRSVRTVQYHRRKLLEHLKKQLLS